MLLHIFFYSFLFLLSIPGRNLMRAVFTTAQIIIMYNLNHRKAQMGSCSMSPRCLKGEQFTLMRFMFVHDHCAVCIHESTLTSSSPILLAYMSVVEPQIWMKNTASAISPHSLCSTVSSLINALFPFWCVRAIRGGWEINVDQI